MTQQTSKGRKRRSSWDLGGLSVRRLALRVWTAANNDDIFGRSAQLAYYFFLALFPALICLTALIAMLAGSGTRLHDSLLSFIATALPPSAYELISHTLEHTSKASGSGKVGFGLIASLWSATAGMRALEDTLNSLHKIQESRPIWKTYGIAVAMTVTCGLLVIVALAVVLGGDTAANFVAVHVGLGPVALWSWKILQLLIAFAFVALVFSFTYYYCPNVEQRWEWLTPGAAVGIALWVLASAGLRLYLHFFNSYTATYGSLGGVLILQLWFYVAGMMLLLGAEVNSEIKKAASSAELADIKQTPAAPQPFRP
jgi:membrane protein